MKNPRSWLTCYLSGVPGTVVPGINPELIRLISRTEYDRMIQLGMFDDERVELLYGVLISMSPHRPEHARALRVLYKLLLPQVGDRAEVQSQLPLALASHSEPEPDLSVVPSGDYSDEHPSQAWLVIEVAATSLPKDRNVKAKLYAECGILEYWIVNLVDKVVEVYREAADGKYRSATISRPGDSIALVKFPNVRIAVSDIF
ncbi:MAG: Uma2 family endonuclease [Proteobacteria bacterium]|nr:Uma2 family endonuclease [Pseudomonadota bacterium]